MSLSLYSINHFDRRTPMNLARWRYRMHGYEGHTHYTTQTRHQKEQSKTTKAKKIFIERKLNLHPDSISKPISLFDRRTPHLLMKWPCLFQVQMPPLLPIATLMLQTIHAHKCIYMYIHTYIHIYIYTYKLHSITSLKPGEEEKAKIMIWVNRYQSTWIDVNRQKITSWKESRTHIQ